MKKKILIFSAIIAIVLSASLSKVKAGIVYNCPGWGVTCTSDDSPSQKQKFKYAPDIIDIPFPWE